MGFGISTENPRVGSSILSLATNQNNSWTRFSSIAGAEAVVRAL
jgi:hypothetical protein